MFLTIHQSFIRDRITISSQSPFTTVSLLPYPLLYRTWVTKKAKAPMHDAHANEKMMQVTTLQMGAYPNTQRPESIELSIDTVTRIPYSFAEG